MPPFLIVQPILALSNTFSEKQELRYRYTKKPSDSKIKTLVLQQIVQAIERKSGALFPSATIPKVVIGLLSSIRAPKKMKAERTKLIPPKLRLSRPVLRNSSSKRIPIGLRPFESPNWINSLVQFLLFLPGTYELFFLIPRSFQSLRTFVDQYRADQEKNLSISSTDSAEWIRCLTCKLPPHFLQRKPFLYEILKTFMQVLFPHCPFSMSGEIHPVVLHPEWHLVFNSFDVLQNKLNESPPELLLGSKDAATPLKSHYFAFSDGSSYDLDAFIELRPDGDRREHYVAYLKCNGTWYQCDDDRVAPFRTSYLNAPLRRATLLHYKRVDLSSRNKILIPIVR